MADISTLPPKHWAILIGLDYYRHETCPQLKGCVRDVSMMKEYLEAGLDPVDITMLTASAPVDPSSQLPSEEQGSWPTWENVIDKLQTVIGSAKKGDFVYIHYSGHGTRVKTSAKSAHKVGNLALVLFNDQHGIQYLYGDILASCFEVMVDKGLLVTVVLDCCFSGSVLRTGNVQGAGIRSVDYDPAIAAATPPEHQGYFGSRGVDYPLRDSTLRDEWIVNPDSYTILSACGPHETAHELELNTGKRRGALSYFLMEALSALRKRGVDITHESLYEYMRIRFHACWPCQTPMRYGNRNFLFFGGLVTVSSTPFVHVYKKMDEKVDEKVDEKMDKKGSNLYFLDAGEAHGVHVGDTYMLYPPDWRGDAVSQVGDMRVTARVGAVRCLTSDLKDIEPKTAREEINTGWRAKQITSLSQRKISVRLPASVYGLIHQARTPEGQDYLHFCTSDGEGEPCMFNIVFDDQGRYNVLKGSEGAIANLPAIPANDQGAEQRLMDTLQHLSKFKYAEGIENRKPDTDFEMLFSLVSSVGGGVPSDSSAFDVEHGGTWQLEIENKGETVLYFTLFNFTPSWKIHNLLSESGRNGFWVLEPKSKEVLPLAMEVPEFLRRNGKGRCEDIIKVFITSRATSFPSIVLPELSLDHARHRGQPHEATDKILALITGLTGSVRGDDAGNERWATRNFIITTRMT